MKLDTHAVTFQQRRCDDIQVTVANDIVQSTTDDNFAITGPLNVLNLTPAGLCNLLLRHH